MRSAAIKRAASKKAKSEAAPKSSLSKAPQKAAVKKARTSVKAKSAPAKEAAPAPVRRREQRGKTEDEMNRYRKLEAVGALAGGIAHDFNNALTTIMHNVYAAKMFLDNEAKRGEVPKLLDACMKTIRRATALSHQLLAFSAGGKPFRKSTYLKNVIRDSADFSLSGSNVGCEFHIADDLWPACVDEVQIEQVISNLVINAKQAMPGGGTIDVNAGNVVLRNDDVVPLRKGRYVKLSVKDMGFGIPEKHLQEIFDPDFDTQEKVSGLGLADSYSIVKNHGGLIAAESEEGVGTTFHVYLPASEKGAEIKFEGEGCVGGGKVLVMESEEDIRDSMQSVLALLGYETEFVEDGASAMAAYKEAMKSGKPFDAVIMDLTVPGGMGGVEAVKALKKIDPDVRAAVASGYSDDPIMADFERYGFRAAIEKPHNVEDLNRVLGRLIAGRGPRAA